MAGTGSWHLLDKREGSTGAVREAGERALLGGVEPIERRTHYEECDWPGLPAPELEKPERSEARRVPALGLASEPEA
jgi:hypothetical protein